MAGSGRDGNERRSADVRSVGNHESRDVNAGKIGYKGRINKIRAREDGLTARGHLDETPGIGDGIAVRVAGTAAIEMNGGAGDNRLIRAGVRHRTGVRRGDLDEGRIGANTVTHADTDDIVASHVGDEGRCDAGGILYGCGAACGNGLEAPGIGQRPQSAWI